jgi:MFS transporter, DHA1 family, inner membrane transport protein
VVEAATDAPNLASTLNQGAFNLGNALGAWIGGAALTLGVPYAALPLIGAAVALVGFLLALSGRAHPVARTGQAPTDAVHEAGAA